MLPLGEAKRRAVSPSLPLVYRPTGSFLTVVALALLSVPGVLIADVRTAAGLGVVCLVTVGDECEHEVASRTESTNAGIRTART
jgi:hypothetical protein